MVIAILDHVPHCYSSEDGDVVARFLSHAFARGRSVTLSFTGVGDATSSFINAAFVSLLDDYDFPFIKAHLSIVDSNRQINDMVRRCFQNAERLVPA
jgi:hypothetical protein